MPCWNRQGDELHGSFSPRQIRWLRKNLRVFHEGLRHVDLLAAGAIDPTSTRLRGGERVTMIASLRHDVPGGGPPDGPNSCFLERMRADVETVLATLPEPGDVVVLRGAHQAWAWIWSLYECGMDVAFRLGVDWGPLSAMRPAGAGRPQRSCYYVMEWLLGVVDELIDVADLPVPAIG